MLKKRIAASLAIKDGIVVQSIGFNKYLPVGRPDIAIEFLNQWGIDEIILVDISASKHNAQPKFEMIRNAAKKCFVPLSVGGGITCIEDVSELLHCGADKVSFNQSVLHNEALITETAKTFGDQCVIASIDAIKSEGSYLVYDYKAGRLTSHLPGELARKMQDKGAGEIMINSVDRDGSYEGYDIELVQQICDAVSIPVIAAGGAKNANDMIKLLESTNASAACAGNFFHFNEHSVIISKSRIMEKIPLRLETFADYRGAQLDNNNRLLKKSDQELEDLLFVFIEKEEI